jgi:hypothetical protein
MERILKVYAGTGHLFAEITFNYEYPRQAKAFCQEYRRLYNDDEEDESKSVFPGYGQDLYLQYREFKSIEEIKAHDKELVKKELGRDMKDPASYKYVYDEQPVLLRYVVANHIGCIGMVNILFSFINNTKEVKFLSADKPRYDFDISSNSLETNIACIMRIPVYKDREEPREISPYDLTRLEPWY